MIRPYTSTDLARVRSLHEQSCEYPFPNIEQPIYLAKHIVEDNGKVIGFGCLKLTSEAIVVVDVDQSTRVRALGVQELISTGIYQCQKLGLTEMHAFLTGSNQEGFERSLKKHFGFVGHAGDVLVLEV